VALYAWNGNKCKVRHVVKSSLVEIIKGYVKDGLTLKILKNKIVFWDIWFKFSKKLLD